MTATPELAIIPNYVNYLVWQPVNSITIDAARLDFTKRFGVEPAHVVQDHTGLWVGPAPIPVEKRWAE